MDYRYKQLEQELSALSKVFSELGLRLSEVAKEVTSPGVMPSEKLLEQISSSRTSFENCRTAVHGHAGTMLVSPLPKLGELLSLTAIDSLLKASAVAEENKFSTETEREKALQILGRVLAITHRETSDFKPLQECHAKVGELRSAISNVLWPHRHPESETVVASKHPSNALLSFVENLDSLDDEKWMTLETTITESYGKPLFVAASRGKLTVGPELKTGVQPALSKPPAATPAPPKAPAPPEPPKPAVAAEKPVEKKIVAEKAPEKPAPTPAPSAPAAAPGAPAVAPAGSVEKKVAVVSPAPATPPPAASVPALAAEKKEVVADKVPHKPSAPPAVTPTVTAPTPVTVVSPAPVGSAERKESSEKPLPAASAPVIPATPIPAPVPVAPQATASVVSAPAPVASATPSPAPTPVPSAPAASAPVAAAPAAPSRPPAPVPVAVTPATPVAATPVAAPLPAAPPVGNNAHPAQAAQPSAAVNSLSALATATDVDKKPVASAPVETIDRQRKEPRLAAPATQPVAKPEPNGEEFMAEEAQKTAAGDSSQRPQRWGFWRGNR